MLIDLTKSCIKQTARFVPPERDRGNSFTMRDLKEPEEEKVVVQDNIKEDGG